MNKTILITGITGSGKSTLVKKIKDEFELDMQLTYIHPETKKKYIYYTNDYSVYLLGKYEDNKFGGIDSFTPKSAAVDLIEFIKGYDPNAIIICEGWCFKRYNYDEIIYLDVDFENIKKRLYNRSLTSNRKFDNEKFENNIKQWTTYKNCMINKWKANLLPYNTEQETNEAFQKIIDDIETIVEQNAYFDYLDR